MNVNFQLILTKNCFYIKKLLEEKELLVITVSIVDAEQEIMKNDRESQPYLVLFKEVSIVGVMMCTHPRYVKCVALVTSSGYITINGSRFPIEFMTPGTSLATGSSIYGQLGKRCRLFFDCSQYRVPRKFALAHFPLRFVE